MPDYVAEAFQADSRAWEFFQELAPGYSSTVGMTPNLVGNFPKSMGSVTEVANGVVYFSGLQQTSDPARANVTALQTVQSSFSKRAIADSQGQLLLVNPAPGQLGGLGRRWIEGPSQLGLDMNLSKRVRITETKEFQLRLDQSMY